MAIQYAKSGPPFHFLGNMSETQRDSLLGWVSAQTVHLPAVQAFHQIRAQQLRKTAGMLEQFHASDAVPENLVPSFTKTAWHPGSQPHFGYAAPHDHEPAMVTSQIKEHFRSHLVRMDDAVFHMNQVRTQIERHEDQAQYAHEGTAKIKDLTGRLQVLFGRPEYEAALVKDKSNLYKGVQRYRTDWFDDPTPYEQDTRPGRAPDRLGHPTG